MGNKGAIEKIYISSEFAYYIEFALSEFNIAIHYSAKWQRKFAKKKTKYFKFYFLHLTKNNIKIRNLKCLCKL